MLGCFLQSYFSGSFRTSWPSLGCIAKIIRAQAISYCPRAGSESALLPGNPCCPLWRFSDWLSALQFGASLELFILQALSFLGASFFVSPHALLFKGPSFLPGSCFLLLSSIFRCCLLCSRWTRNE